MLSENHAHTPPHTHTQVLAHSSIPALAKRRLIIDVQEFAFRLLICRPVIPLAAH